MLELADDLASVFFSTDFAMPLTRQRPAAGDITVMAIIGAADDQVLEGRAMAVTRVAHFAAGQDVRAGDKLITQAGSPGLPAGTAYRVLDAPRRVNDGLELEALLGSAMA